MKADISKSLNVVATYVQLFFLNLQLWETTIDSECDVRVIDMDVDCDAQIRNLNHVLKWRLRSASVCMVFAHDALHAVSGVCNYVIRLLLLAEIGLEPEKASRNLNEVLKWRPTYANVCMCLIAAYCKLSPGIRYTTSVIAEMAYSRRVRIAIWSTN